jgi:hypothetical protein
MIVMTLLGSVAALGDCWERGAEGCRWDSMISLEVLPWRDARDFGEVIGFRSFQRVRVYP